MLKTLETIEMFNVNHDHFAQFHSIKIKYNETWYEATSTSLITGYNIHIYKTNDNMMIFAINENGFFGASAVSNDGAWKDLKKDPKPVFNNVIGISAPRLKCNACASR